MIRPAILSVALAAFALPAAGAAIVPDAPAVCLAETPVENTVLPSPGDAETDPSFTIPNGTELPDGTELPGGGENPARPPRPHGERGGGRRHRGGSGAENGKPCPYVEENDGSSPGERFRGGSPRTASGTENTSSGPVACGVPEYVLNKITPEFIAVYEKRVAGCELVSGMSGAEISLAASELGVSEQKFKALVLLADLMARTSKPVPMAQLAAMGDGVLLRLARKHAKMYASSLPESDRDMLKDEFRAAMKK